MDETKNETNPPKNDESGDAAAQNGADMAAEMEKLRNEHLYLRAEFDNYRKQAIRERSELIKYGAERVLQEMLNFLDNVDRALDTASGPENHEALRKGFELIASEFRASLQKFGVQEIPSMGEPFNPQWHEALSSAETDTLPAGHVMAVHRKPYKLHDRILRPGQVVVAKEKTQA